MTPPPSPPSNSRQDVPRPPPPAPPQHPSSGPQARRAPPPQHPSSGRQAESCSMHANHTEFLPMIERILSHRVPPYQRAVDQLHQLIADIPSTADFVMVQKSHLCLDFMPYVHLADGVKENLPREIEAARLTSPDQAASIAESWERLQPLLEDVREVHLHLLVGYAQAARDAGRTGGRVTISGEGGVRAEAIFHELAESDAYGPVPGVDLSQFLPPPRQQSRWKSLASLFR